jgi:phage gp36-like protein
MTYATRQDLAQHYGQDEIDQRESMLGASAVDTALIGADALIDGYLATRYSLPLSDVPANLVQFAAAIARYKLLGDAATERARLDYQDAVQWLKDVAAGRVQLQASAPVPGNAPEAMVLMSTSNAVFKRGGRP